MMVMILERAPTSLRGAVTLADSAAAGDLPREPEPPSEG